MKRGETGAVQTLAAESVSHMRAHPTTTLGRTFVIVWVLLASATAAFLMTAPTATATTYIVSLMPHVVSVVISPRTYVVAVAVGAVIRNAAVAEASSTQTITKVRPRVVVGWARMCDTDSAARVCPALVPPRFHTTLYYPKDAVIAGDIEFASG